MEHNRLELTSIQYEELNKAYPESDGSSVIGKRAEKIVKIYFLKRDPQCQVKTLPKGADLLVVLAGLGRWTTNLLQCHQGAMPLLRYQPISPIGNRPAGARI
jgi:hypothetical protein